MEDEGLDMHGILHEQWKRDRVVERLKLLQERHDITIPYRLGTDCYRTYEVTSAAMVQERVPVEVVLRRKGDGRLTTAGKVSFWGPKEEPVCCKRCVSAARSLPCWLFGGCKTVDDTACKTADDTPGTYDDTTPPPVRYATPHPSPFPSGDTYVDTGIRMDR